ncbi:hypothetical protein M885DRAFT_618926 [Pelagophyceae sp. CCMP2097]|nr:hypothetical protein M885DRAFT_618926 [Pelagophyceae sp. CCMP2097]|mmetsp:Transcript_54/g.230  ORF Transcript_54/g.230 Transcript_54/m.230 type:complete len:337 (+) Transcript_54:65-1075(+)
MPSIDPGARWSNAAGDLVLGVTHAVFLAKVLRLKTKGIEASLLKVLTLCYFTALGSFQLLGAFFHVVAPVPHQSSKLWLTYLVVGAAGPCCYGAILSVDHLKAPKLAAAWVALILPYIAFAHAAFDMAAVLTILPTEFTVTVHPALAKFMADFPWMPSALAANAQTFAGEAALLLRFDGRGYAATPFSACFDSTYSKAVDLLAPFPCWRSDSLTVLMLVVGTVLNSVHLRICYTRSRVAAASHLELRRKQRASNCLVSHAFMALALTTMPLAMLVRGVSGGIDWMHACAAPGMFLQCRACVQAIVDADERRPADKASAKERVNGHAPNGHTRPKEA